jgi:uncharacterized membrane protein YccC
MTKRQPRPDRRFRRLLPTVLSSAALAAASLPGVAHAATGPPHLTLRPTATGYALVSESGRVAYSADGARARERCLRRALQLGVVRLR